MELGNSGDAGAAPDKAFDAAQSRSASDLHQRDVISTGHVALTSADLVSTRSRLDGVLAREGGVVADENTVTDEKGVVTSSHLVVRVPSDRFDQTMTSLGDIATLRSSSRKAQDVTTQVIDLHARILAEKAGVKRLRLLVSRTGSLGALLNVERALTERQGELESLQQQALYLRNQTSQATITVDVALQSAPKPAPAAHAAGGFVGGLHHGWDALVAVVTAVLLAFGAALPFAVAVLLLGVPVWLVVRRMRRPAPPEEAPAES
jgi:hypothetical protein